MSETTLDSLRSAGAARLDPARFRYLEALSQRIGAQPAAVQQLLQDKMQAGLAEYARRFTESQAAGADRKPRMLAVSAAPLAQLNAYIRTAAAARSDGAAPGEPPPPDELASARRFRSAWHQGHADDQVRQAVARKPANAGPLNSHVLVLQSLAMLQELSPAYLRRFVVQVEALQWLEQAAVQYPKPQAKKAAKKTRRSSS